MTQKINLNQVSQAHKVNNTTEHDFNKKFALQIKLLEASLKHVKNALLKAELTKIEHQLEHQEALLKADEAIIKLSTTKKNKELMKICKSRVAYAQKKLEADYKRAVAQVQAARAHGKGAVGKSHAKGSVGAAPPSGGSGLPGWFNPNVPPNFAAPGGDTDNPNSSMIGKLLAMIRYIRAIAGDPAALAAALKTLETYIKAVVVRLSHVKGGLAEIAQMFKVLNGMSGDGQYLTEFLIKFMIEDYYYEHGKNSAAAIAYAKKLEAELRADGFNPQGPEIGGIEDLLSHFAQWAAQQNGVSKADFLQAEANALGSLMKDPSIEAGLAAFNMIVLNALLKKYGGNVMIAILLWFFQNQDNISESTLAGYNTVLTYIEKEINNLNKLSAEFNDGNFSAASAKKWYELLMKIRKQIDSSPLFSQTFKDRFNGQINAIEHLGSPTLATLFAQGASEKPPFSKLKAALNKLSAGTGPVGKSGQILLNNLKDLNQDFTDQSTVTNTRIQKANSAIQTVLNALNKTVNEDAMAMLTAFVKNQHSG